MRILDKNKDYYDYLQCYEDDLVYDRRGSYILTDQDFRNLWIERYSRYHKKFDNIHLLLNVGYTYWLIVAKCLKEERDGCGIDRCIDYSIELVDSWKDYNHFNSLHFGKIKKDYTIEYLCSKKWDWKSKLIDEIKLGNYEYEYDFTESMNKNLIFRDTKIPSIVKAEDLYYAFDEYFSHLKDDVKVDNMTDIEKVESHGFDKKTSFRGK